MEAGFEGALLRESEGGGGNGAAFVSPIRSRVRVSWAFVGTPLKRELESNISYCPYSCGRGILLQFRQLLPVRIFAVQILDATLDNGVSEETKPSEQGAHLDEHIAGC